MSEKQIFFKSFHFSLEFEKISCEQLTGAWTGFLWKKKIRIPQFTKTKDSLSTIYTKQKQILVYLFLNLSNYTASIFFLANYNLGKRAFQPSVENTLRIKIIIHLKFF